MFSSLSKSHARVPTSRFVGQIPEAPVDENVLQKIDLTILSARNNDFFLIMRRKRSEENM